MGFGFWSSTLLVRPFQPSLEGADDNKEDRHREETCQLGNGTASKNDTVDQGRRGGEIWEEDVILGLELVFWPYVITGLLGLVCALAYLVLGTFMLKIWHDTLRN